MPFGLGSHHDHVWSARSVIDIAKFVFLRSPKVNHVVIIFRSQKFSVHGRRTNHCDLSRVTDDLLNFEIGVLLGCIITEQPLEVCDNIVIVIRDFYIGHDDIVGRVCPVVLVGVVNPVSFAGEVETLNGALAVLLQEGPPLEGSHWPIQNVLEDEVVIAVIIFSPLDDRVHLASLHLFAGILILISSCYIPLS